VVGALALAACGGDDEATSTTAAPETSASGGGEGGACTETTKVKLTLQWVAQAQFAGNFAALDQGYYDEYCIELELQPGGPDINAVQLLLTGDTDIAGWQFGAVLTSRAEGADVISIGQVFERSGYQLLSFAYKGIETAEDALQWPSEAYKGFFVDGQLVAVFPPKHSILTITETAPPIRGAGSGGKEAVLENGMKVKVNLLCDVGDKVRIDTETMEFKERIAK
jgi:hypothetical protein